MVIQILAFGDDDGEVERGTFGALLEAPVKSPVTKETPRTVLREKESAGSSCGGFDGRRSEEFSINSTLNEVTVWRRGLQGA